MSDAQVIEILAGAFEIAAKIGGPILLTALFVGVTVSLLQTITQIQEMTLTFVPKLIAMALVMLVSGRWMIREMINWVEGLWSLIPSI